MVCIPGQIREGWTEEEYANYKSQADPSGEKRRRVDCEFCGASLAAGSYRGHLETQHDVFRSFVLSRDIEIERPAVVYRAIELPSVKSTTARYRAALARRARSGL